MRYVDIDIRPEDRWLHPLHRAVCEDPELTAEFLHRAHALEEGIVLILFEASGPPDRLGRVIEDTPNVEEFEIVDDDGSSLVYAHLEQTEVLDDLVEIRQQYRTIVEEPLEFWSDGTLTVTVVGDDQTLGECFVDLPDYFRTDIRKMGSYSPESERLFDELTARQQEILETAVAIGYYREPRQETHADIAEYVDCSPATVGEHLRKIESKLFQELVPGSPSPPRRVAPAQD